LECGEAGLEGNRDILNRNGCIVASVAGIIPSLCVVYQEMD
jgi:hypothetical protein